MITCGGGAGITCRGCTSLRSLSCLNCSSRSRIRLSVLPLQKKHEFLTGVVSFLTCAVSGAAIVARTRNNNSFFIVGSFLPLNVLLLFIQCVVKSTDSVRYDTSAWWRRLWRRNRRCWQRSTSCYRRIRFWLCVVLLLWCTNALLCASVTRH